MSTVVDANFSGRKFHPMCKRVQPGGIVTHLALDERFEDLLNVGEPFAVDKQTEFGPSNWKLTALFTKFAMV